MNFLQKLNKKQWLQVYGLGAAISLLLQVIIIPAIRWGGDYLLLTGENPVVSVISGVRLVQQHPLVALGILIEIVIITLLIDVLTVIWVAGIDNISREINFKNSVINTGKTVKKRWASAYWPSLLLFLALLPLFSICFRTPLLIAGRAPIVFLDYITRNKIVFTLCSVLYLIVLGLAWQMRRILILLVCQGTSLGQARRQIHQSGTNNWRSVWSLVMFAVFSWVINGLALLVLHVVGQQPIAETIALIIINVVAFIALMSLLVDWQLDVSKQPAVNNSSNILSLIMLLIWICLVSFNNYRYVKMSAQVQPVALISHRGVVDKNGVQNTIPAMQKTHRRYHPDMVEIDLHETKDHRWVVMHDENYQKLTGVNKLPRQLTLHQATKLVTRENGYQAHVASFDQYLKAAEKAHQRLLVEIKTTGHESPDYLQQFNRRYRQRLLLDHDYVQSMDYDLVKREQKMAPGLKPIYIQAYDVGGPSNTVGGINIEYSGINQHFVWQSHKQGQVLYGWTVNNANVANQLSRQGVDGIITDRLPQMRQAVADSKRQGQSWRQLWAIINPLCDWTNWQNLASK